VWQPCELLYTCYTSTVLFHHTVRRSFGQTSRRKYLCFWYGGPQVPTFVQRPGTSRRHHSHARLVWLVHQSLVGAAPAYLADDCRLLSDVGRRPLRSNSNDKRKLLVPRTHNKLGDWSFSAAGPHYCIYRSHQCLANSRTFQDLALRFPRHSKTRTHFRDYPGPGNFTNTIPGLSRRPGNPNGMDRQTNKRRMLFRYTDLAAY